jgi:DNA modification methylase
LAMAQKMNRHAIGFELDEKYIPIIKQRLGLEDSHE